MLNEGFEDFSPGEYVGFELEDPSLEEKKEEATFIYAIIVEEINSQENASVYTKRYKVNVGHEKQLQVAESTDLYKFHNLQTHSENQERPTSEASKKELFIRIAKVLNVFRPLRNRYDLAYGVKNFAKNCVTSDCSQIWHKGS